MNCFGGPLRDGPRADENLRCTHSVWICLIRYNSAPRAAAEVLNPGGPNGTFESG